MDLVEVILVFKSSVTSAPIMAAETHSTEDEQKEKEAEINQ